MSRSLLPPRGVFIPTRILYHPKLPKAVVLTWAQLRGLAWGLTVSSPLRFEQLLDITQLSETALRRHMRKLRAISAMSWRCNESGLYLLIFPAEPDSKIDHSKSPSRGPRQNIQRTPVRSNPPPIPNFEFTPSADADCKPGLAPNPGCTHPPASRPASNPGSSPAPEKVKIGTPVAMVRSNGRQKHDSGVRNDPPGSHSLKNDHPRLLHSSTNGLIHPPAGALPLADATSGSKNDHATGSTVKNDPPKLTSAVKNDPREGQKWHSMNIKYHESLKQDSDQINHDQLLNQDSDQINHDQLLNQDSDQINHDQLLKQDSDQINHDQSLIQELDHQRLNNLDQEDSDQLLKSNPDSKIMVDSQNLESDHGLKNPSSDQESDQKNNNQNPEVQNIKGSNNISLIKNSEHQELTKKTDHPLKPGHSRMNLNPGDEREHEGERGFKSPANVTTPEGIYRSITGTDLDPYRATVVKQRVTDLDRWRESLQHWIWHGWSPTKILSLLELYNRGGVCGCGVCAESKVQS